MRTFSDPTLELLNQKCWGYVMNTSNLCGNRLPEDSDISEAGMMGLVYLSLFWERVSCIPDWPETCFVAKGNLEFLVYLFIFTS